MKCPNCPKLEAECVAMREALQNISIAIYGIYSGQSLLKELDALRKVAEAADSLVDDPSEWNQHAFTVALAELERIKNA